jgi:hypothetical protein
MIVEVSQLTMDAGASPPEISESTWPISSKIAKGRLRSCNFSFISDASSVVRPIQ